MEKQKQNQKQQKRKVTLLLQINYFKVKTICLINIILKYQINLLD